MSLGCVLLLSVFTVSQFPWGSTGGMGNWGLFPTMTYEYEQPSSYSFSPGGISNVGGVFTYTNPQLTFGELTTVDSENPQPWGFPSIGGNTGNGAGYGTGYGALNAMAYGMSNAGMGYSPYGAYGAHGASYSPYSTNGGYSAYSPPNNYPNNYLSYSYYQ